MRVFHMLAAAGVAAVLSTSAFAQAEDRPQTGSVPTAESAAKQVGKPTKSSTWKGKRVQPSDRLPSSDQVKREQPGTMPPTTTGAAPTPMTPDIDKSTKTQSPSPMVPPKTND